MPAALPEQIWPRRLARSGHSVSGRMPLSAMARLAEVARGPGAAGPEPAGGGAEVDLRFENDAAGRARIRGRIAARVEMICQRCLESMPVRIESRTELVVVEDGEAVETEPGTETLEIGDEPMSLSTLVEDELLLAVPDFAAHPPGQCEAPALPPCDDVPDEPRENPFAALRNLKGGSP